MDNNRTTPRVRTILGAYAVVGKDFANIDCKVKDMSETGARLVVDEQAFLPRRFTLKIPRRNATYLCEIRWQSGESIGVEFVTEPAISTSTKADPEARIQELQAEVTALRRRVTELTERLYTYGDSDRPAI